MIPSINVKRVYEKSSRTDGLRILVDRLWPRGLTKEKAAVDEWDKDMAPSTQLRKWFNHIPTKWSQFKKKYMTELRSNPSLQLFLKSHRNRKTITLLYAAKDQQHNEALVLQQYLTQQFHKKHL